MLDESFGQVEQTGFVVDRQDGYNVFRSANDAMSIETIALTYL